MIANEDRLRVVGLVVAVMLGVLALRLAYLQTVDHDQLTIEGERNFRSVVYVAPTRGRILDRFGRVLIDNLPINTVRFEPGKVAPAQRPRTIAKLAAILDVSYADIEKSVNDPAGNPSEPIEVARHVKESTVVFVNEHLDRYPGVTTSQTWERVYPNGALAAHVLGYVGRINAEDLAKMPDDLHYQPDDMLGQSGIEKSFERELRGFPGKFIIEKDSRQRVVKREEVYPPTPGADVRLTIDIDVQRLTEQSLARGLRVARLNAFTKYEGSAESGLIKAHSGSAVVTDPNTGEIIAMASYPTFDPRNFVQGISAKDYAALTAPDRHTPLINRAVSGRYPPGSTFKLVTALAALETKDESGRPLLTPSDVFDDVGYYEITSLCQDPRKIKCRWRNAGSSPYGQISLRTALKVSSDAFFYKLGHDFAKSPNHEDGIQKMARALGFGRSTNVRLPSESSGVVPDRARLDRLHRLYPKEFPRTWKLGDTINVAIGQGDVLVTPLQMNRAWGALANGGTVLDAKIELEVRSRDPRATTTTTTTRLTIPTTTIAKPAATVAPAVAVAAAVAAADPNVTVPAPAVPGTAPQGAGSTVDAIDLAPTLTTTTLPPVTFEPTVEGHVDLPDDIRSPLIAGFEDVVGVDGGTAVSAFSGFPLRSYRIAGKTGTAQKTKEQDYAVFVGFGPVDAPKYVVSVVMEEGGYGRQAGAVVRRIFEGLAGLPVNDVRVATGTLGER